MTREEWRKLHRDARQRRTREPGGFVLARDDLGLGVTQRHDKGHSVPQAAIASVLRHAAAARKLTPPWREYDHACYIDRVKKLRKHGTWL